MIRQFIVVFVLSWIGLIGQSTAHGFMMVEMQQQTAVVSEMNTHCQPVLCEVYISHDIQAKHGLNDIALIDLNKISTGLILVQVDRAYKNPVQNFQSYLSPYFDQPPLQKNAILLI